MKKQLLFILFLACFSLKAQIKFEKGYFINNQDVRSEVLIKNIDWLNTPKDFIYKISEDGPEKTGNLMNVKEFGVTGESKFIRSTVQIDKSSDNLQRLEMLKDPEWINETLFLKTLSEGKANLYHYKDERFERFFYSKTGIPIQQLVYKRYYDTPDNVVSNRLYKKQLKEMMQDQPALNARIDETNYQTAGLIKIFNNYNNVGNTEQSNEYKSLNKKIDFNLYIRPGISNTGLKIYRGEPFDNNMDTNFDPKYTFRLGIEAEFILPFNRNKFALILEPTYINYKQAGKTAGGGDAKVDFSAIEIPAGVRYYIFLNDHSKIFVNASFVFTSIAMNKSLEVATAYSNSPTALVMESSNNFAFGVGYNYKSKYSLEFRTFSNRNVLNYVYWNSNYQTSSLIFGYNIF